MVRIYIKSYKTLLKVINDVTKWEITSCSWTARLSVVHVIALLRLTYRFSVILIKSSGHFFFFAEIDRLTLNSYTNIRNSEFQTKNNLKKKEHYWMTQFDFKTHYIKHYIKLERGWFWRKDRYIGQ